MGQSRAWLTDRMNGYLEALASRDPGRAHLADAVRFTENGQLLPIGEGAWATADRIGPYRHDFVDMVTGNIATITTLTEGASRSILVVRLQANAAGISEIETIVARPDLMGREGPFAHGPDRLDESGGPEARWFAPIPPDERLSRAALRDTANLYFAGLERNDGQGNYPFADDCIRIENGFRTTGVQDPSGGDTPYTDDFRMMTARQQFETGYFAFVDRIRHRRFPVIDEEHGLVFAFGFFDHSGSVRRYRLANGREVTSGPDRPFTWEIAEAFRIERGLFSRIEAVMTGCPYGMPPNWPMLDGDIA